MSNKYRIGHDYKDILSVSRKQDEFVSWFSHGLSGIGNSGGIRAAKYLHLNIGLPSYIVLITRGIAHRWYNPWEDIVDYSTGTILYWGDSKFHVNKKYDEFRGNKHLRNIFDRILDNKRAEVPPILHFSKVKSGVVKFNGLCVLTDLDLTWFEDKGNPAKNYRCELTILDIEEVEVQWLHERVDAKNISQIDQGAPAAWADYLKGKIRKLDMWSKSVLDKTDQVPPEDSADSILLSKISGLTPVQFEMIVVELFRNLPHVDHKIVRTRPTADGGFDFFGKFTIPYPIRYEIEFLGEAKKYSRNVPVQPKHVSRLVARLSRGQFGLFVTTSYYTRQTQKEVLEDGYPVRLFSGNDLVNILRELRLVENDGIKKDWLDAVFLEKSRS